MERIAKLGPDYYKIVVDQSYLPKKKLNQEDDAKEAGLLSNLMEDDDDPV